MENTFEKADELSQHLRDYVQTRLDLLKLEVAEKSSAVIGKLIALMIVMVFFVLCWTFLNVALAFFLSDLTGSGLYGFLIVSGFNLLIGWIIWIGRDRLIRVPIMNAIIAQLYKQEEA